MNDRILRNVFAIFLLVAVVLVAGSLVAVRNINASRAGSDWVNHTHAVILETEGIISALQAGDGALRTYIMTGDLRDRADCRDAYSTMAEHLDIALTLTRNEPEPQQLLLRLQDLVGQRVAAAEGILGTEPLDREEALQSLLAADASGASLDEIRRLGQTLRLHLMDLLAVRDTEAFHQAQVTRWTVWLAVGLNFLLLAGSAWLIRDDIAARRRAAALLEQANVVLEARVRERTVELETANGSLTAENLERRWANQALEHQLRYNLLIVNSINDMVFVLTKAMNVSRVNPAVVHVTGQEPSALLNRPLSTFVRLLKPPTETESPLLDPLAQALREGHDLRDLSAIIEDRRGRKIPGRLMLFPIRDRDKVVGGVVILQRTGEPMPPDS